MLRTNPLRALAVTATLSALVLTGCSEDTPVVEEGTTQSSTEDSSQTPAEETAETTEEATGAATTEEETDSEASTEDPGTDTDQSTESAEEGAVSGPLAATDGTFEVTLPDGWLDVREDVQQEVEVAVRDDEMTDDFYTNFVVVGQDPVGQDLEEAMQAAAEEVAGPDGEFEMLDPVEIAGQEVPGFVLKRVTSGVPVAQTQWWVEHEDRLYVATFSAAASQQEATQAQMEELLATWTWTD